MVHKNIGSMETDWSPLASVISGIRTGAKIHGAPSWLNFLLVDVQRRLH
jgi:hypothetical protein